jgi:hypothetical protein
VIAKTLTDLASEFLETDRPIGTVIDPAIVTQQAVVAARKYAGYGPIASLLPPPPPDPTPPPHCEAPNWGEDAPGTIDEYFTPAVYGLPFGFGRVDPPIIAGKPLDPVDWVDGTTVISQSEWAVIRPLFLLYVEREQALYLESTRAFGSDVYGRSSSEIMSDIDRAELDLPGNAFVQPVISV